jgi:hypothetical protein
LKIVRVIQKLIELDVDELDVDELDVDELDVDELELELDTEPPASDLEPVEADVAKMLPLAPRQAHVEARANPAVFSFAVFWQSKATSSKIFPNRSHSDAHARFMLSHQSSGGTGSDAWSSALRDERWRAATAEAGPRRSIKQNTKAMYGVCRNMIVIF